MSTLICYKSSKIGPRYIYLWCANIFHHLITIYRNQYRRTSTSFSAQVTMFLFTKSEAAVDNQYCIITRNKEIIFLMHETWNHAHGCNSNTGWIISSGSCRQASHSRLNQLIPTFSSHNFGMVWKTKNLLLQYRKIRDIPQSAANNCDTSATLLSRICSIF